MQKNVENLNIAQFIILGLQNNTAGTNAVDIITSLLGNSKSNQITNAENTTSDSERNLNAALSAVTGQKTPLQQSANGGIIDNKTRYSPEEHKAAILKYKSSDAYKINALLRENKQLDSEQQEFVDTLDEALKQLPTYEGTVYRNITFDDFGGKEAFDSFIKQHTPGEFIFYEQFVSCSIKQDGYPVEGDFRVQLLIESKNARDVDGFGNNTESEVIFPLDSAFIVQEVRLDGEYPIIILQEAIIDGYQSVEEQGDAVRNMYTPHTIHDNLQSVSEGNTEGNNVGSIRPQSSASGRPGDTVRTEGRSGAVLPAQSAEQEIKTTEATSDNEAAFSMPENGAEGDYSTEGNTDPTQTAQEPQGENTETESGIENSENGADEDRAVFTTPSEKEIYREPSSDEKVAAMLGNMKSTVQRQVEAVAGDFGIKMLWSEKITVDDGIYDPVNRTITLNPDTTLSDAYIFLFKHEFVHSLEIKKGYKWFKDYLYAGSVAFEEYIRSELKEKFGVDFEGTRQEVIDKYVELYWEKRKSATTIPEAIRDVYTRGSIEREIVADFVADNLLGAKDGVQDFSKVEAALSEMANTHRNIFQKIIDFIKDWITKLKGAPQNRTLVEDLEYLNRRLMRVYDSATNKKAANDSGVKHSFKNAKNGLSNDLLLHYDAELTDLIEQRGDYIIDSLDKLKNIVDIAFNNPQQKSTAYFGIIPAEILSKIENSIPNIPKELNGTLFKGGKTYSVAATLDSIQHLAEDKALTREDIVEYLDKMADTIVNFDTVNFDYYYQGNQKSKGIVFKKAFKDGTIQSFEIVSSKKRTLNLQTIYMENGDYQKKKSAETLLMEKPSADAQGAGRSDSNISIPIKETTVKNNISEETENRILYRNTYLYFFIDQCYNLSKTKQRGC